MKYLRKALRDNDKENCEKAERKRTLMNTERSAILLDLHNFAKTHFPDLTKCFSSIKVFVR